MDSPGIYFHYFSRRRSFWRLRKKSVPIVGLLLLFTSISVFRTNSATGNSADIGSSTTFKKVYKKGKILNGGERSRKKFLNFLKNSGLNGP